MSPTLRSLSLPAAFGILVLFAIASAGLLAEAPTAPPQAKRWTDDELVAGYRDLAASGGLTAAILAPSLPKDPPQASFLEALAWYAAGTPEQAGSLTRAQLDAFIAREVRSYKEMLAAKVEQGAANDYPRTRTWKVIQKLTLLGDAMVGPPHEGRYAFPAIAMAPDIDDPWEREHTLRSAEEFGAKICQASAERLVLVKFGNTNCTQCMLFEMIGSVKEIARRHEGVDVYKLWWGGKPDDSFAGKIADPARLDELAKAEGVRSSPYFIVYRNGRRYPCGDAFPDASGLDAKLEACLSQEFGAAPTASVCPALTSSTEPDGRR